MQVGGVDAAVGGTVSAVLCFSVADAAVAAAAGAAALLDGIRRCLLPHLHQLHAADLLGHDVAAADAHAAGEADATAFVVAVVVQVAGGEGGSAEAVAALRFGSGC